MGNSHAGAEVHIPVIKRAASPKEKVHEKV
jgi:hypothetical protein